MTGSLPPSQDVVNEFVIAAHHDLAKVQSMLAQDPLLLNENAEWIETPIQASAHVGNRPIAEFLLAQGAPLDICTAAMLGDAAAVSDLLRSDAGLSQAQGAHGIPVMFYPVIGGHQAIAQTLFDAGADINAGGGANTPLHGAVQFGQAGMVAWLLEHGADVEALDYNGKTPLELAVAGNHDAIADLLRTHGAME
jgi:uncharacterized protein